MSRLYWALIVDLDTHKIREDVKFVARDGDTAKARAGALVNVDDIEDEAVEIRILDLGPIAAKRKKRRKAAIEDDED